MQQKKRSMITLLDISKFCFTDCSNFHCHSPKKSSRVQCLHIQNETERKLFKNPFKFLFNTWLLEKMHTCKHNERLRIDS